MTPEQTVSSNRSRSSISWVCWVLSFLLLVIFVISHATRIDPLMMATILPLMLWLTGGVLLAGLATNCGKWRIGLVIAWLLSAIVLGDAPQSLLQTLAPQSNHRQLPEKSAMAIRIISLNCQSRIGAVKELRSLEPNVVLTQESPSRQQMEELIESEYEGYRLVWGPDAAMLVRGSVIAAVVPNKLVGQYVFGRVKLENGAEFNIGSTRLIPSPLRFDVWNPTAWREFADNRRARRIQLTSIFQQIGPLARSEATVFGGDFNAPAGDAIFEIMRPELRDGWPKAGRGWGKTIINSFPMQRIDQIWISPQFQAKSVIARKTENSDHRMVISDLNLKN